MKEVVLNYVKYNLWANRELANRLESLSEEDLVQKLESSFPTLIETISHIFDAECIWLKRLQGESISYWPSKEIEKLELSDWVAQSEHFLEFIENQNEQFFKSLCTYSNTKGKEFSQLNYEVIMHCMNHSTFHRGQVVSMLRQLGEDHIPQTDLIKYWRLQSA